MSSTTTSACDYYSQWMDPESTEDGLMVVEEKQQRLQQRQRDQLDRLLELSGVTMDFRLRFRNRFGIQNLNDFMVLQPDDLKRIMSLSGDEDLPRSVVARGRLQIVQQCLWQDALPGDPSEIDFSDVMKAYSKLQKQNSIHGGGSPVVRVPIILSVAAWAVVLWIVYQVCLLLDIVA